MPVGNIPRAPEAEKRVRDALAKLGERVNSLERTNQLQRQANGTFTIMGTDQLVLFVGALSPHGSYGMWGVR